MRQLSSIDDLSSYVVDDGYSCRFASRINLDTQWLDRCLDCCFENDREWKEAVNRCFSSCQQYSCFAWINWIYRLFVGIEDKNAVQWLVPFGTTGFPGNGGLDNVQERFGVASTGTNPRKPV